MHRISLGSFPMNFRQVLGEQLFENAPIHVAVIDRELNVVVSNGPFCSKFGEAEGKPCYEVYKRRSTPCETCKAKETFADGKVRLSQETGFDTDGNPTSFAVQVAPLFDENGQITHIIEMSYDTTQLKELQEKYDDLFERVPCSISVIDKNLKIVRSNRQLTDTFGEVEGQFCYKAYKNREKPCPYCPVLKTFEDGQKHSSKHTGITKQGKPTHYVVSSLPLKDGGERFEHVIEMSIDVTEAHDLSRELLRENEFRHNITENLLDALIAVDEEGRVKVFNPAAEKLFGVPAKEILGTDNFRPFFPEEFRQALVEGGSSIVIPETTLPGADGEPIPVRVSGSVLRNEHGVVVGGAASFQDLREIKRLEQEKLERERLAAVGQTVAVIAHAIKNILVGIQGGMYKLNSGRRKDSQELIEKGLVMLDRNFNRVAELVRGLLDLSRSRVPNLEKTSPHTIAAEVHQLFQDAAAEQGIEFVLDSQVGDFETYLDAEGMHACLDNLVSNAFHAVGEDKKPEPKITLTTRLDEDVLVFECTDNGAGMSEEVRKKLFDMFFTTKGVNGSGLGLSVTQKIIQEHGGTIDVESEPGRGTTFRILLPINRLTQLWEQNAPQALS